MTPLATMLAELRSRNWPPRAECKIVRTEGAVTFCRGGMQASAHATGGVDVEVIYEEAAHECVRERLSPLAAAHLIEAIFGRTSLHRVEPADA